MHTRGLGWLSFTHSPGAAHPLVRTPSPHRSTHRPEWRRLPQRCVYYYRSPMHDNNYVLSIIFTFDKEDDVYEFAYSYPYTYTQLQHDLAFWDFLALPYLRRACLCRTPLLKRLDLLTIAEPMMPCALLDAAEAQATPAVDAGGDGAATGGPAAAAFGGSGSSSSSNTTAPTLPVIESLAPLVVRRKAVAISCRIHPGETPPSHVLCGFLNFVLGPSPEASALRSALTFVVVPMLNPDGVFLGNYRADAGGLDLNRQWLHAHPDLTPSLHHWCQLLLSYDRHPSYDLDICIDMHAHSNSRHSFMYVNAPSRTDPDAVLKQERINKLPRLLDAMMTGFRFSACSMDDDPSKAGCARRVLSALLPGTECYTLEISFYHSNEPGAAMAAGGGSNGAGSSGAAPRATWLQLQ